jgi:hypothetical protein
MNFNVSYPYSMFFFYFLYVFCDNFAFRTSQNKQIIVLHSEGALEKLDQDKILICQSSQCTKISTFELSYLNLTLNYSDPILKVVTGNSIHV